MRELRQGPLGTGIREGSAAGVANPVVVEVQLLERRQGPFGTGVGEGGEAGVADLVVAEVQRLEVCQRPFGTCIREDGDASVVNGSVVNGNPRGRGTQEEERGDVCQTSDDGKLGRLVSGSGFFGVRFPMRENGMQMLTRPTHRRGICFAKSFAHARYVLPRLGVEIKSQHLRHVVWQIGRPHARRSRGRGRPTFGKNLRFPCTELERWVAEFRE